MSPHFLNNKNQNYSNPIAYFYDRNFLYMVASILVFFLIATLFGLINSAFLSYPKYRKIMCCGCKSRKKNRYGRVTNNINNQATNEFKSRLRISTKADDLLPKEQAYDNRIVMYHAKYDKEEKDSAN